MSRIVIDTNVLSFVIRRDNNFKKYRNHIVGREWHVSFMTLAELHEGVFRSGWSFDAIEAIDLHLNNCEIVFPDLNLCSEWGRIRALRRNKPIPVADCCIAATALSLNCPIVTHNPRDFVNIPGLKVIAES
jgi:tRNA(fMet)-specific endonuclease VapC